MKRPLLSLACLLVAACGAPPSEGGQQDAAKHLVSSQESLAKLQVDFGMTAPLASFPATCSFDLRCTAVLVGPEALLTAAHCVSRGEGETTGKGTIMFFNPSGERGATCLVESALDLAVCKVDPVERIAFERLSTDPLTSTSRLLLTGFGRTETGAPPGGFHTGHPQISSLPEGDNNLIHLASSGGAILDGGDSGGPTYLLLSEGVDERVPRLLAGINSNNLDVTSVSTPAARKFICDWAAANVPICGCPSEPEAGCRPSHSR